MGKRGLAAGIKTIAGGLGERQRRQEEFENRLREIEFRAGLEKPKAEKPDLTRADALRMRLNQNFSALSPEEQEYITATAGGRPYSPGQPNPAPQVSPGTRAGRVGRSLINFSQAGMRALSPMGISSGGQGRAPASAGLQGMPPPPRAPVASQEGVVVRGNRKFRVVGHDPATGERLFEEIF